MSLAETLLIRLVVLSSGAKGVHGWQQQTQTSDNDGGLEGAKLRTSDYKDGPMSLL